ncbi:hypothetical protein AALO_G00199670 [Alosa alosa]|uniref:Uncharacterized protein n=1 Tax=Alosa alosa TaxID=278164 RepID=A0AAV6G6M9_9TELE|nr:hypothetical protein AALO_G00199670 [Alosa alosa]
MQARTMLAIMDLNENHSTKRQQAFTAAAYKYHDHLARSEHDTKGRPHQSQDRNRQDQATHNIREKEEDQAGLPRHSVFFQKQSKQWIARPTYVETTQKFRDDLIDRVIQRRLDPIIRLKNASSRTQIPRIALIPKLNKEEVIQSHTSRFKGPSKPF